MRMPYVIKVVIFKVTVYKDDKDADYYSWQGAEVKQPFGIEYMKAWPCKSEHKGFNKFNLDKNDETPFECVPNALFKMYWN